MLLSQHVVDFFLSIEIFFKNTLKFHVCFTFALSLSSEQPCWSAGDHRVRQGEARAQGVSQWRLCRGALWWPWGCRSAALRCVVGDDHAEVTNHKQEGPEPNRRTVGLMDLGRTLAFVPGVSRAQRSPLSGAEWWELIRFAF